MTDYLGDNIRSDIALINMGGATLNIGGSTLGSTLGAFSKAFSLAGVHKVMVLCGIGPSTGVDTVSATFTVRVGTYTAQGGSAMTALTGATLALGGDASSGDFSNVSALMVHTDATGAITAADTWSIDGTTYTMAAAGTVSDKTISTGNIAFINDFQAALATGATHIEVFGVVSSTDARAMIRPKDYGFMGSQSSGMGITATTNATTGELEQIPLLYEGVLEFTPNDVLATNSSYTHFAIEMDSPATTVPMVAVVIRVGAGNASNVKRTVL